MALFEIGRQGKGREQSKPIAVTRLHLSALKQITKTSPLTPSIVNVKSSRPSSKLQDLMRSHAPSLSCLQLPTWQDRAAKEPKRPVEREGRD